MKVELGAGSTALDGWVSVDLNPKYADIVADAFGTLPFADGEVEALRAIDCLEHGSYRDTDRALAEWARVCAPDAPLFVQVPDFGEIIRWYVEEPELLTTPPDLPQTPLAGAVWRLFGGHADGQYVTDGDDFRFNAHYAAFTHDSLRDALERAGFTVDRIATNPHPNLQAFARKR